MRSRFYNQPYLLLTLAVLFWSANLVIARGVRFDVPPLGLAFWRWAVASLISLPFALPHLRRDIDAIIDHWRILLVLSVIGVTGYNALVYIGVQSTTAVNGVLMQSAMPVIIILASYAFFRQGVTAVQGAGVFVSLGGVAVILSGGEFSSLAAFKLNLGDLWVFLGVACYAVYSTLLRARPNIHPLSFLAVTFVIGMIFLLPPYIYEIAAGRPTRLDDVTVFSVAYVALFPSVLSYLFYNRGVELAGANRAGMFIHLLPVFGTVLAVGFLGETLRIFHLLGFVFILGGIFLTTRKPG